jgi:hypothetical protein
MSKEESREMVIFDNKNLEEELYEIADKLESETIRVENLMSENILLKQTIQEIELANVTKRKNRSRAKLKSILTPKYGHKSPATNRSSENFQSFRTVSTITGRHKKRRKTREKVRNFSSYNSSGVLPN